VKLRRLLIHRMPGFERRGLELDGLAEGLTLVVGPNGSGKTSCCRAIRGVLWPSLLEGVEPVSIESFWQDGEGRWMLGLEAGRRSCELEAKSAESPALPSPALGPCFTVTLESLGEPAGRTEGQLAEQLARQMAGGFDLAAVREQPWLKIPARPGLNESKRLEEARRQVRELQQAQFSLRAEEQQRVELEARREQAERARQRLGQLERVQELLELRDELQEARAAAGQFPPGMERLFGGEGEDLQQIRRELQAVEARGAQARREIETARQRLDALELPVDTVPDGLVERLRRGLARLEEFDGHLRQGRAELARCRAAREDALRRLGSRAGESPADAESAPVVTAEDADALQRLFREIQQNQADRDALQGQIDAIGDEEPACDPQALTDAAELLRQWLEYGSNPAADRNQLLVWALGAVLVAAGCAMAAVLHPAWAILVLPAVLAGLWAWLGGQRGDPRPAYQQRFSRLGVDGPSAWQRDEVGRRLREIEQLHARVLFQSQQRLRRRELETRRERLLEEGRDLRRRLEELTERMRLPDDCDELGLVLLAHHLLELHQAEGELAACEAADRQRGEQRDRALEEIRQALGTLGDEPGEGVEAVRSLAAGRLEQLEAFAEARRDLDAAERAAAAAAEQIEAVQNRRKTLFERAGLEDGDEAALRDRLARLEEFSRLRQQIQGKQSRVAGLEGRLADMPELLEMDADALARQRKKLESLAAEERPLIERITSIGERIELTCRRRDLQEALARRDEAEQRLRVEREDLVSAALGRTLLEDVQAEYTAESRPQVFREAERWFAEFTRGRYALRLHEGDESRRAVFFAEDRRSGRGLKLDQLSRGTATQLMLAVRLAFAASAEQGRNLPFLLDDVLSSSDPERFRAIAEALLKLIAEGRQVLYFTCQPADATALKRLCRQQGVEGVAELRLDAPPEGASPAGGEDEGESADLAAGLTALDGPEVPAPAEAETLAAYARRLGSAELDLLAPADAAPLACLLETPGQLHRLARAGLSTLGQFRTLREHGGATAVLSEAAARRLLLRGRVLAAFREAWHVGRARAVTPEVLRECGLSENFFERVCELAADLNYDAERLVEALDAREDPRTKGFRSRSLQALREQLQQRGYLDDRNPLDREQIRARVLAAVAEEISEEPDEDGIDAAAVAEQVRRLWVLADREAGEDEDR
jgi:DNA repair exonuclease SbcCD ATPase subunit